MHDRHTRLASELPQTNLRAVCFKLYDLSNNDAVSRADLRAMTESTVECALTLAEMAATILAARNSVATRYRLPRLICCVCSYVCCVNSCLHKCVCWV